MQMKKPPTAEAIGGGQRAARRWVPALRNHSQALELLSRSAHKKPRCLPERRQRGRKSEEAHMLAWGAVLVKRPHFGVVVQFEDFAAESARQNRQTVPLHISGRLARCLLRMKKAACSPARGMRPREGRLRGSHLRRHSRVARSLMANQKWPRRVRPLRGLTLTAATRLSLRADSVSRKMKREPKGPCQAN
jgi:hypothetical protein